MRAGRTAAATTRSTRPGGWYDAGDHGKYVVNGGISVWTLLEPVRAREVPRRARAADFARRQAPDPRGQERRARPPRRGALGARVRAEGCRCRKASRSRAWCTTRCTTQSGRGSAPRRTRTSRRASSTSRAPRRRLNVAATAAQARASGRRVDSAFSAKCLKAAERAWAAAKQNPALLRRPSGDNGGGPYDDTDVKDEFYWAAAELFVTTGKPEYAKFLRDSPLNARFPTEAGGGAASSELGGRPTGSARSRWRSCPATWTRRGRRRSAAASRRRPTSTSPSPSKEGYRTLVARTHEGKYDWGSNSGLLNNMLVVALAHDFTKQPKYLDGVVLGMDYILGRNPLGQSYVTGYGDKPLENPHHRFWAHQANASTRRRRPARSPAGRTPRSRILMPRAPASRVRPAAVLRGQHRGLEPERDHDQLERAVRVGDRLPRREGEAVAALAERRGL